MPYKSYISTSYDMNIYSDTQEVQSQKLNFVNSKNQLTFLWRCIANNVIPKPFQVKKVKVFIMWISTITLRLKNNEAKERIYLKSHTHFTYNEQIEGTLV